MTDASTTALPGTLAALRERYGNKHRWYLLLAVMVGTMASIMSSTIVNVAIPDVSQHFTLDQIRPSCSDVTHAAFNFVSPRRFKMACCSDSY